MSFKEQYQPSASDQINRILSPLVTAAAENIKQRQTHNIYERKTQYYDGNTLPIESVDLFPNIFTVKQARIDAPESSPQLKAFIGDYGEEWAKSLVKAAQIMTKTLYDPNSSLNIIAETNRVEQKHKKILEKHTYHAQRPEGTVHIMQEGIQSTLFTASVLTMHTIPGYENNPQALLNALVDQKFFSKLALIIPAGVITDMGQNGVSFTEAAVIAKGNGQLGLRSDIIAHFTQERLTGVYQYNTTSAPQQLDRPGCPLARTLQDQTESAVNILARAFAENVSQS